MRTNTLIGACLILLIAGPFAVDAQVNTTVEILRVPADGSSVTAKTRLKPRKIYYIIADGRVWDNESVGLLGDAEYDNISTEPRDTCGDGVTDTGIGINSRPIYFGGTGKKNRWGPFNGDNRYEMVWVIGKDDSSQVSFSYHDCVYQANNDYALDPLTIEIQAPQSGDCAADVNILSEFAGGDSYFNDVKLFVEGHTFDSTRTRAHMCAGTPFYVWAHLHPDLDQPLRVQVSGGVTCKPDDIYDLVCTGLVDKNVKLTFGSLDSRNQFKRLRAYNLVPVNPYK